MFRCTDPKIVFQLNAVPLAVPSAMRGNARPLMVAFDRDVTSDILQMFREVRRPTSKHDTYYAIYDELFAPFKGKDVTFVEVGISGGGSLEVWKRYFGPGSRIIGIDLNSALREVLEKDGFEVFVGDQADPAFWRSFYTAVGNVDIVLDDGGHTNTQMWTTFVCALDHMRDGGLIVIEDTHAAYMRKFGNPSSDSIISRMAACIDELNYRSSAIDERDRHSRPVRAAKLFSDRAIADKVHSIRFYQSIVALSIDSMKCHPSRVSSFGSVASLPEGKVPVDYRERGIRETLRHRLRGRLRSLRHRWRGR